MCPPIPNPVGDKATQFVDDQACPVILHFTTSYRGTPEPSHPFWSEYCTIHSCPCLSTNKSKWSSAGVTWPKKFQLPAGLAAAGKAKASIPQYRTPTALAP